MADGLENSPKSRKSSEAAPEPPPIPESITREGAFFGVIKGILFFVVVVPIVIFTIWLISNVFWGFFHLRALP